MGLPSQQKVMSIFSPFIRKVKQAVTRKGEVHKNFLRQIELKVTRQSE